MEYIAIYPIYTTYRDIFPIYRESIQYIGLLILIWKNSALSHFSSRGLGFFGFYCSLVECERVREVGETLCHPSKEKKDKDLNSIDGESVEWGFKPSTFPGMNKNVFLSFVFVF